MRPILFTFAGIPVRAYAVMSLLAMFGAMIVVRSEARRLKWNVRAASWLVVQCTALGFCGAHTLYMITRLNLPSDIWWQMFLKVGYGHVWFGGLLTSWAWCRYWARKRGINTLAMYDVAALAVLIANPVGRIGCFLNGCCFGTPTELPWGVPMMTRDFGFAFLHPVPIYEMLYQFTLFAIFWSLRKKNTKPGQTIVRYLVFMPLGRFLLEFLRGDSIRGFVASTPISTSQLIALFLMAAGVALHFHIKRKATAV